MKTSKTLAIAVATMVSTSLLTLPSHAGSRDFVGGVAVGVGGTLLYQHLKKKKKKNQAVRRKNSSTKSRSYSAPARPTIATVVTSRADVVDIQSRLNQLGFDAGTPDGIPGKRTRAAVRGFQQSIGSNPTGKLTQSELAILYQQTSSQTAGLQGAPLGQQQTFQAGQQPTFPTAPQPGVYQQNASTFPLATGANSQGTTQPNQFASQQTAPQVTFPAIATGAAVATGVTQQGAVSGGNQSTFPIASSETQPTQQVATFPTLGVPANGSGTQSPQPGSTIPEAIPSDAIPQSDNSQIASLQQPSAVESVDQSLPKPSIFGVSPGSSLAETKLTLANEGFGGCVEDGKFLTCQKNSGSINDRVVIARSGSGDDASVYMMARELSFEKPVRESFIKERLEEAYPRLINEPDMKIASSECKAYLANQQDSIFRTGIENSELNDDVIGICPDYYSIHLGNNADNTGVKSATIILFDSNALNTGSALSVQEQELEDNIKF